MEFLARLHYYDVKDFVMRIVCAIRGRHDWGTFPTEPYASYSCHRCHTDVR